MKAVLSTKAKRLLDQLTKASEVWGWEADQGYIKVDLLNAEKAAKTTKKAMARYISNLEQKITELEMRP